AIDRHDCRAQPDLPEARGGAERVEARRRALIAVADQLAAGIAEEALDDLAEREQLPVRDDSAVLQATGLSDKAEGLDCDGTDLLGHARGRLLHGAAQQPR